MACRLLEKLPVFKYSAGTLGRTVCVSVVTLIMQGLCDAISKTEEKFK